MSQYTLTSAPGDGSRTITMTNDPTKEEEGESSREANNDSGVVTTLRLRGGPRRNRPRVAWDEGVIDNEGCGRKSSKVCCIYHKPRRFDESSDSGSDSDSDNSCDGHDHDHSAHQGGGNSDGASGSSQPSRTIPASSKVNEFSDDEPNAYEKMPSRKKGKRKAAS